MENVLVVKPSMKKKSAKRKGSSSKPSKKSKMTKPSLHVEAKESESKKDKRKSRWETPRTDSQQSSFEKITPLKDESKESDSVNPVRRIGDLLSDKKTVVEYLFQIISGPALQELIPDYLKNFTVEELKQLCFTQIQSMSDECILNVISGKESFLDTINKELPSSKTEMKDGNQVVKDCMQSPCAADERNRDESFASATSENSADILELCPSLDEIMGIAGEDSQSPFTVEEIAKDFKIDDKDVELMELEMRARAIRSLLKARAEEADDREIPDDQV